MLRARYHKGPRRDAIAGRRGGVWDKMLAMGHLLTLIALVASVAVAQNRGALLVATAATRDTDFAQTVILVLDRDAQRSTGLVLNRPVKITLAEVFPDLKSGAAAGQTAWAGGPILIGVNALLRAKAAGADEVLPHVRLLADKARIRHEAASGTPTSSFRVYLGVCGWGAHQLDDELRRGMWRVVPGTADVVFDAAPGTLWTRLTRAAP